MTNKTIRTLSAGVAVGDADLFLTRQGADTSDTKITGTQLTAYTRGKFSGSAPLSYNSATGVFSLSGTKSQFNTALSDGDFLYVGDVTQYTDEQAQDAIGTILANGGGLTWSYNDVAPSISATVSITAASVSDFSEAVDDRVSALLTSGDAIVISYDDVANTLEIRSTAVQSVNGVSGATVIIDPDDLDDSLSVNKFVTAADETKLSNLSGVNTGDQTSIAGITGTKAQFDTAVTDGNFLYVGDVTQYTDELAQDAVGAMVDASLTYVDATPLLQRAALTGAITASAGSNTTALGSFTKAQLDTAVSDGNVLYVGDVTQYTDEQAQDAVGTILTNGGGVTWTYNDAAPTISAVISITSGSVTDFTEAAQDAVGASLTNGGGLTWTYNDVGNTISAAVSITSASVTDFTEAAQDATGAMVNATLTYNDAAPSLGINLSNANTWAATQTFDATIHSLATVDTIASFNGTKTLTSLATATYPTLTELSYVKGVTSAIQTQFSGKEPTITGAATTITGANLTIDRALTSNGSGKVAVSATTSTELGYVSGVTSALQTQINGKEPTITGAATTITSANLTVDRALTSNGSGKIAVSAVTSTELGYVSGVTSAIQTQLDARQLDIQFKDEGTNTGTSGGVTTVNFTGAGVTASESTGTLTVNIPGGGSSNSFETIAVAGQSNVVADATNDTLTLVAGTNITITTNATSDTITINSTGGGSGITLGAAIMRNVSGNL